MSFRCRDGKGPIAAALLALSCLSAMPAAAEGPRTLRVCADPNNLPFSNVRQQGFENRIAQLIARELHARLQYTWWPQRRGFIRNTLKARACDVVMGVPRDFGPALTTLPYYRSGYVFIFRKNRGLDPHSLDDPALRRARIGVQMVGDDYANSPPAHALARRGLIGNVRGYSVYGDYARPDPPGNIVKAVARGDIDVAIAWGPLAGYLAGPAGLRWHLLPPAGEGPLPFAFDIAIGVRHGEEALRDELQAVMKRKRRAVDAILEGYRVPRLDRGGDSS